MKANPNPNLIAVVWTVLFIVVLSLGYNAHITNVKSECVQSLVKNGSPALEAAKACN